MNRENDGHDQPEAGNGPVGASARTVGEELPAELVRLLPERDPGALEAFYESWFDRIYAFVRRMVGQDQLAEDLTQDIFMQLHRTFPSYDPARPLQPWVFTVATNKVRDHWRSRRHKLMRREVELGEDERGDPELSPGRGPSARMENRELAAALVDAVESLPESMRATFGLRYYEGLPFDEIGRILGRNEEAVRKRYSRAMEELRRVLAKRSLHGEEGEA